MKYGEARDYTLAVIFHILQMPDMPQISEKQISSQIEALNRDFGEGEILKDHPNDPDSRYSERMGNARIQFCMPSEKELFINRRNVSKKTWTGFNEMKSDESGGISPIEVDRYINVWVTDLDGISSGFAQSPSGREQLDGIVIDYACFGIGGTASYPYDQGKTLTHLMGNYLGLLPLWGDHECGDDYVDDTPIHNAPNFLCPEFDHITTCDGNATEMTMNFMDATSDECKYLFTQGQVKRMQAALSKNGPRGSLSQTPTECDGYFAINRSMEEEVDVPSDESAISVELVPNPARDVVYINFEELTSDDFVSLHVVDISGRLVLEKKLEPLSQQALDIGNFHPGVYIFQFTFNAQKIAKKLIIE